jgi:hypothetical protein
VLGGGAFGGQGSKGLIRQGRAFLAEEAGLFFLKILRHLGSMKALQSIVCALVALSLSGAPVQAADAVSQLLTEAQTSLVRGDRPAAKAKFQSVLTIDPKNVTAKGYLAKIAADEAKEAVGGSQEKQLAKLMLPKVDFKEATFSATLDYLKQSANKLSDGKQAVNFVVQLPEAQANTPITLSLTNVPFTEVLKYLGSLANVSFSYDRYAITVRPAAPTAQATTAPAPGQ